MTRVLLGMTRALLLSLLLVALGLPLLALSASRPQQSQRKIDKHRFMSQDEFLKGYQLLGRKILAAKARLDKLEKRSQTLDAALAQKYPDLERQYNETKKLTPKMAKLAIDAGGLQLIDLAILEMQRAIELLDNYEKNYAHVYVRMNQGSGLQDSDDYFRSKEWKQPLAKARREKKSFENKRDGLVALAKKTSRAQKTLIPLNVRE